MAASKLRSAPKLNCSRPNAGDPTSSIWKRLCIGTLGRTKSSSSGVTNTPTWLVAETTQVPDTDPTEISSRPAATSASSRAPSGERSISWLSHSLSSTCLPVISSGCVRDGKFVQRRLGGRDRCPEALQDLRELVAGEALGFAEQLVLYEGVDVVRPDALERCLVEVLPHEVARTELEVRSAELVDELGVHHVHELGYPCRPLLLVEPPREQPIHRPAVGEEGHEVRSEEHTSELQSLMRISYAVFCLKKKRHKDSK